jgi:hypothetical protein
MQASFRMLSICLLDGLYSVLGQMCPDELNLTYRTQSW